MATLASSDRSRGSAAAAPLSRRQRATRPTGTACVVTPTAAVVAPPALPPKSLVFVDVLAGAAARAASQSTIHPLDTLKVRMQAAARGAAAASAGTKYGVGTGVATGRLAGLGSLYSGLGGAAGGAGLAIGTYFAFYGAAQRALEQHTLLPPSARAFLAGAAGAVGSSIVKVPAAVCIRSVQARIYPNVAAAARAIVAAAGVRGLFTGYLPTILEDVPDMAVKFAAYESLRAAHARLTGCERGSTGKGADLLMGGTAGALAAAATTPLDVLKTRMMVAAGGAHRPTLSGAFAAVVRDKRGIAPFFAGVGPRALSNGLNSAVFFMFYETLRAHLLAAVAARAAAEAAEERRTMRSAVTPAVVRRGGRGEGGMLLEVACAVYDGERRESV